MGPPITREKEATMSSATAIYWRALRRVERRAENYLFAPTARNRELLRQACRLANEVAP